MKDNKKWAFSEMSACDICGKLVSLRIVRHLKREHRDEKQVAELLGMEKSTEERQKGFDQLINLGNLRYNGRVLRGNDGEWDINVYLIWISISDLFIWVVNKCVFVCILKSFEYQCVIEYHILISMWICISHFNMRYTNTHWYTMCICISKARL